MRRLQIRYINATFTFQSGSIQIGYGEVKYMNGTGLYIPIWLYSNAYAEVCIKSGYQLYIPIWLYSNNIRLAQLGNFTVFTFQSGYIQIFSF